MKLVRHIDLRMVDISDFIIALIDPDVTMCGTWEEIFNANRQKKPILIMCEQGFAKIPKWLFGTIPKEYFFTSWDNIQHFLQIVDSGNWSEGRWTLLDHSKFEVQ